MHFRLTCFILFLTTGLVSTDKSCRMPSGGAGECKPLKKCKPLFDLNKKKGRTGLEILYIRQSLASCSITSNFQALICCPPVSQWTDFKGVKPVIFEEIEKYDDLDIREKPNVNSNENNNGPLINKENEIIDRIGLTNTNLIDNTEECGQDRSSGNRIAGGGPAAIDQYPWLVLLEYQNGELSCGGALITKRFVLTAAHCIKSSKGEPKYARLAEYNTTTYPTDTVETDGGGFENITVEIITIVQNIAHPNYTRAHHHHDIGLSKLKKDAVLGDFINILCLPTQDFMKNFNSQLPINFTVAGWGSDGEKYSEVKKFVDIPYVPKDECQLSLRFNSIIDTQLCAGGNANEDSCSGDSGGPLMYEHSDTYIAIGIVSYGSIQCGSEGVPAVYTYVYSYLDWLHANMV